MTRVLAAFVKSAVNTAAMKQVADGGLYPTQSSTSWTGKQAYASWRHCYTGLSYAERQRMSIERGVKFRINYPAMPDDALLTRAEADLIAAYTLHETGHILYTNNQVERIPYGRLTNPTARLNMLANGFEDARMERAVIRHGARNARTMFQRLLNMLTADIGAGWNPCDLANAPFALALLGREHYGNGNAYTANLLSRIPEDVRAVYQAALEMFDAAPSAFDEDFWAYVSADRFLQLWDAMRRNQGAQPDPAPSSQPPQPQPDEGDADDNSQPDDGDADDTAVGNAPWEEGDEPDTKEAGAGDSDDGDDGDDDIDAAGSADGDDADNDTGDDADGDDGDDADANGAGDGEGDGAERDDASDFKDNGADGESFRSPEPDIAPMVRRINKRTDSNLDLKLSAFSPAPVEEDVSVLFC